MTGATTEIIENLREGRPSDWLDAWIRELSSGVMVLMLIPVVAVFLRRLNPNFSNLRWRALRLLLGFVAFSLIHIAGFIAIRTAIRASPGASYEFGSIDLGLLYEIRKDFLVYVGIVCVLYGHQFILDRRQGEARFLATEPIAQTEPTLVRPKSRQQFLVKMLNKEYLVRVDEIDWILSASNT